MRKYLVVLLTVATFLVAFVGVQAGAAKVALTVWGWNITIPGLQAAAKLWLEKNPGVDFKWVEMSGTDVEQKLRASLMAGTGAPDISPVQLYSIQNMATTGGLEDLSAAFRSVEKDFAPFALAACEYKGKLVACPWDIGPVGFYYRSDLFEQAGVRPPKTWAEIPEIGKKLTKDTNGDGKIDQYFTAMALNDANEYLMYLWSRHGLVFDKNGKFVMDNEVAKDTFKYWTDLMVKHGICLPQNAWEPGWYNAIKEGRITVIPIAVWFAGQLKATAPELAGKWRVAPWPSYDGKPTGTNWGGSVLVVPKQSKNKKLAIDFVKFAMATPEGQLAIYNASNIFPAYMPALKSDTFNQPDPYFGGQAIGRLFVDTVPYITPFYFPATMGDVRTAIVNAQGKVINRKATADQAWEQAVQEIKSALAR